MLQQRVLWGQIRPACVTAPGGGEIGESNENWDALGMLQQLGVLPETEAWAESSVDEQGGFNAAPKGTV
jgi:hypothetical protein